MEIGQLPRLVSENGHQGVYSPNGDRIAFRRAGEGIFVMGATGGNLDLIINEGFHLSWSPDGTELVYTTASVPNAYARLQPVGKLKVVNIETKDPRLLFEELDSFHPSWSPNGKWIAFCRNRTSQRDIYIISARPGGEPPPPHPITDDPFTDWGPFWSPEGNYLYFLSDRAGKPDLWRVAIDEDTGETAGKPESVFAPPIGIVMQASISGDGSKIVCNVRNEHTRFVRQPFDPLTVTFTGPEEHVYYQDNVTLPGLSLSPDGEWLAFWSFSRARSELANAEKDHARQLDLARRSVSSDAQLDDASNRLRVAQAELREANATLKRAQRDLARTQVLAPYDGRVRSEQVDVGQFVNRGESVAKVYAVDFAEVRLPIPDEELAYLDLPLTQSGGELENPVTVTLRARFAGKQNEWQGEIVRTEGELDPRTRMVHVVARVAAPYAPHDGRPPLAVGLFVEAEILGSQVEDVVVLPRSALRGASRVLVVDADDRLRFRDVEVLRVVRDQVFVRSGLARGERVCVSALEIALEGMRVRVNESLGTAAIPSIQGGDS